MTFSFRHLSVQGLILLAIIVVVSYKVCFAKNKMNNFGGEGGGSASYSANPYGTSGAGVSYGAGPANGSFYDGAAAAYRRGYTNLSCKKNISRQ